MSIKGIIKGLIAGVVLTVLFLLLLTVISYYTEIPQEYLNAAMYVCTAVAVILGSIVCVKISGQKLLPNCILYAICYIALLVIASLIKNGAISLNIRFFSVCGGVIISSLAGTIIANKNFM